MTKLNVIQEIEKEQLKSDLPKLEIGQTLRINYKIVEGNKERTQPFEGVLIARHLQDKNAKATFTIRRVNQGYAIERIFPLHSPRIESIKIVKTAKVRRAKLYYLRNLKGKAARLKERIIKRTARES